ncbi:MAG TPA: phytanoyl-CoA dioxygenase family protein [Polyangiaceae bacterium]|jgi:ectoine hydroxylase-related dioxygenase (phytanoyl-CoA dioxygenase family)|nr:phytanoyl-CoA dioxygenase family protein [Polyangiaceae bacterium]
MNMFSKSDVETFAQTYAEQGYLVIRDVVPKAQLSDLRARIFAEFDRAKSSGQLFSGGGQISGHLNCFPGEDSRFALAALEERGVTDLIRQLYDKPMPLRVSCNFNLPRSVAQHYHMDGVFTEDFMIANVAVVDTDLVNGAIDVLPGTHTRFFEFWRYAVERRYRSTTRLPLKQGDVLLRTSRLWHRGMPNRSVTPRPMLAFTFGEKVAPTGDPFRFNEGKINFDPNWFRPNFLGRLRERTFVTAPITYSAYRFARSLVGKKGYDS